MKALIMAAGRGTRISKFIDGNPKCTVDIGGVPLIKNTITTLKEHGITDIGIILGYKKEIIEEIIKGENVKVYYNHFYNITNSIASAWFAKDFMDDDMIILNGDVYFERSILEQILSEELSPVLFSDETRKEEADYKFYYENNKLIKYGKELVGKDITGEYVGIARINKKHMDMFKNRLNMLIENQKHDIWWENVLYSLSQEQDIHVKDVEGKFWAEVDYIEDYERILEFRNYKIKFNVEVIEK